MNNLVSAVVVLCVIAGVLAVALVRARLVAIDLAKRNHELENGLRHRDEELTHWVSRRLPAVVQSRDGQPVDVPGPLHGYLAGTAVGQAHQIVLDLFGTCVADATTRAERSAMATMLATMKTIQAATAELERAIADMQDRHDDPNVTLTACG